MRSFGPRALLMWRIWTLFALVICYLKCARDMSYHHHDQPPVICNWTWNDIHRYERDDVVMHANSVYTFAKGVQCLMQIINLLDRNRRLIESKCDSKSHVILVWVCKQRCTCTRESQWNLISHGELNFTIEKSYFMQY